MIKAIHPRRKRWFTALLCLLVLAWTILPIPQHTPRIVETVYDHLEMIEEHGHSHGFVEDLLWAMHGHSHEVADHDHAQLFLVTNAYTHRSVDVTEVWDDAIAEIAPITRYQIDRPPPA